MTEAFGAKFLAEPDFFPARVAGAPWGPHEVTLALPSGVLQARGLSEEQARRARQLMGVDPEKDAPPGHAPTATLRVFRVEEREFRSFSTAGWEMEIDLDPEEDALRLCSLGWMGRIEGLGETPSAQRPLVAGLWTWHEDRGFDGALENLLRAVVAYGALGTGGVLLHSASVLEDRGATVLVGRSGAGKSTFSRLSLESGRGVLSDDLNVLVPAAHGWSVVATPFGGDHRPPPGARGHYPLRQLTVLAKGTPERLEPMEHAEAYAALFACSPFVNRDPHRFQTLSSNLQALVSSEPVSRLTFARAGSPWTLLS